MDPAREALRLSQDLDHDQGHTNMSNIRYANQTFLLVVDDRDGSVWYQCWDSEEAYERDSEPVREKIAISMSHALSMLLADTARGFQHPTI